MSVLEVPRSMDDIRDLNSGVSFPGQALSDSKDALLLFCAGFYGRQDAFWVAAAGLRADCVDMDAEKLETMRGLYPDGWTFTARDAFEFVETTGGRWDVVVTDSWSNRFQECADMLPRLCSLARNVVCVATGVDTVVEAPAGWQVTDVRRRSRHLGGVFWTVLEPTGHGVTADKVSACLVTRGDQPEQMIKIISSLPYDEVVVWDNSQRQDFRTFGRYAAMELAKHDVVYFQDDDTLFTHHDKLMAAYEPGTITAVYGHGHNHGGYNDLPLVCGGGLADRQVVRDAIRRYRPVLADWSPEELAYADFAVGVLAPFKHVHLPFEINMPIAQHPSRLVNQPWAAEAKRMVTERARAIRDGRT